VNLIPPGMVAASAVYPDSDGLPMADNTKQARWIVVLFDNLLALFRERLDVFVAANLLWYAAEGEPEVRAAPDVLVVFGRPRGDRGSYRQWEEDNVPVTVVFEVLSPGNDYEEMDDKQLFYEEHGVLEYYVYNPDRNRLKVFLRQGDVFRRERKADGFVSPRLGIRFDLSGPEMRVFYPDGTPFLTFEQLKDAWEHAHLRAEHERQRADQEQQQRLAAEERAEQARQRAARLAELGRKARRGQASADELRELERLEDEAAHSP
jgi:Uma2 family endonuclease